MSNESEEKKSLKERMAGLTLKQKIAYLWEYEKWKVIIPIIAIAVIVSLTKSFLQNRVDYDLYISVVNSSLGNNENVDFVEKFLEDNGLDSKSTKIMVDCGIWHPWVEGQQAMDNLYVAGVERYSANLMVNKVDITIAGAAWTIDRFTLDGAYWDLSELLPEELYKKISDRIYYAENSSGEKIPVGVILNDIDLLCQYYNEPPILAVALDSENIELSIKFIEWIFK